ncbi:extracellular solute-binding protein [Leucobacter sp. gxy201]|uniref:ABC transporter substrate-binding protein n=1 Tax=Leucobacter sp. gxy201 TaxID=2957200 RepID=UPI003DA19183
MLTRKKKLGVGLAMLAVTALVGCSGGGAADGGSGDSAKDVEVFTWWAQGSEKAGLEALEGVFAEQHPDFTFVNGSVAGGAGSAAKDLLQSRLQTNNPPDSFQAHAGEELADYIEAGQLEDVSALYDEYGLNDAFPSDLVDLLTVDGKIYSVPSNIHRSNVVWANNEVLEAAGIDPSTPPADFDAWIADLDKVAAAGQTPLSVAQTWTQVNLLETVLMSSLGAEAYTGLFDGTTDWSGPEVTGALENFEKLMSYTNDDRDGLDWPEATQMVIDGQAAYNVMGDWAVAAFQQADKKDGEDFTYFEVPADNGNTDKIFGFLADSFTLPVGAKNPDGAKAWLNTISSVEGQEAFNLAKGSIPARVDTDNSKFPAYQQTALQSFAEDKIAPSIAHGAATPIAWLNAISDATSQYTAGATDLAGYQTALAEAADQYVK